MRARRLGKGVRRRILGLVALGFVAFEALRAGVLGGGGEVRRGAEASGLAFSAMEGLRASGRAGGSSAALRAESPAVCGERSLGKVGGALRG